LENVGIGRFGQVHKKTKDLPTGKTQDQLILTIGLKFKGINALGNFQVARYVD